MAILRGEGFCSPARISQTGGLWYLRDGNAFFDGCKIDNEGHLIGKPHIIDTKTVDRLKKQITAYCKLITKDNLPVPDNGDCWFCSMYTKEGQTLGDVTDSEHLLNHLTERYLHGSILVNAMKEARYDDRQIGIHYQMRLANTFRRAVRKYLNKRLIQNIAN